MKKHEHDRSGQDHGSSSVAQGPARARADKPDLRYEEWKEEVGFFDGAVENLVNDARYKGRYVAVKGRRVIDSDANDLELAKRMARLHPGEVVLIARVDTRARRAEVPSPEVFR